MRSYRSRDFVCEAKISSLVCVTCYGNEIQDRKVYGSISGLRVNVSYVSDRPTESYAGCYMYFSRDQDGNWLPNGQYKKLCSIVCSQLDASLDSVFDTVIECTRAVHSFSSVIASEVTGEKSVAVPDKHFGVWLLSDNVFFPLGGGIDTRTFLVKTRYGVMLNELGDRYVSLYRSRIASVSGVSDSIDSLRLFGYSLCGVRVLLFADKNSNISHSGKGSNTVTYLQGYFPSSGTGKIIKFCGGPTAIGSAVKIRRVS